MKFRCPVQPKFGTDVDNELNFLTHWLNNYFYPRTKPRADACNKYFVVGLGG